MWRIKNPQKTQKMLIFDSFFERNHKFDRLVKRNKTPFNNFYYYFLRQNMNRVIIIFRNNSTVNIVNGTLNNVIVAT